MATKAAKAPTTPSTGKASVPSTLRDASAPKKPRAPQSPSFPWNDELRTLFANLVVDLARKGVLTLRNLIGGLKESDEFASLTTIQATSEFKRQAKWCAENGRKVPVLGRSSRVTLPESALLEIYEEAE